MITLKKILPAGLLCTGLMLVTATAMQSVMLAQVVMFRLVEFPQLR